MEFGIASVAGITVICYLAAQAVKATNLDNKWLPVICGVNKIAGGLLGGVKFVIMVWILFLVVTVLCNTKLGDTALKLIMQDPLLNYLYDKDILIKIFMNIFYAK